ncbi:DUF4402 domain-containing protein [Sphingomonas sp. SUN039]|uniref:DUF4402 domain-containing protein n=1 Tax=Sphingomonas sp. SUN039 TaxID=2937787 RepID=UPI0021643EDE|nr:DUF4402 domain-containing protein [Sphingomonas sp. SUN039]UVO55175.1 DUF4402 domain-containing protein [Sphingomonas sp. SUN039]
MDPRAFLVLPLLLLASPLAAECRLCAPDSAPVTKAEVRPLNIEVETALDFSRAAGTGAGGSIAIDERTGARRVAGLADLGGIAIKGTVRLTGAPFARVRVSLPPSVRLLAPDGNSAEAVDLKTDLPPDPMLDASGELRFSFGGRLVVSGSAAGEFRGRIPIVADYQ